MKTIEKTVGTKIGYDLSGTNLTIGGALMLSLSHYQKDWPVHVDVMADEDGNLALGSGRFYVAEVDVPARTYDETQVEDATPVSPTDPSAGTDINRMKTIRTPKALNTDGVTLTLWSIDGLNLPVEE